MATHLLHVVPACIGAQLLCNNPTSPKNVRQQDGGKTTTTTKTNQQNVQSTRKFNLPNVLEWLMFNVYKSRRSGGLTTLPEQVVTVDRAQKRLIGGW